MEFYDLKLKKMVKVPHNLVKEVTLKNGRKALKAQYNGRTYMKFIKS